MSAVVPSPGPVRARYQVTFAVLVAAIVAYALLQSLVSPVLPTIQHHLHTSQSTVTWVLTGYLLAASIATPIVGRLGDMIGKKRVFVAVMVVLAIGTLLSAVATSISIMIIARVIQGVGGAVLPLSFGIIRDEFPREKVPVAISTTAALVAVGGGLGVVLAGPIVSALDYHYLFWLPLILIVIATIAAQLLIPESEVRTPGKISLLPAATLTAWLVALLVAVSEGSEWGWGSGRVLGLLAASVVLIPVWIWTEVRAESPLIDMKMMRLPAVWTTNVVAVLFGMALYSVMAFIPEFLQTPRSAGYGFGASITRSGLYLLPLTVMMFLWGLASGRLAQRVGARLVLATGSAVTAAALLMLSLAHRSAWEIYVSTGLIGAGMGLAFSAMSNIVVASVPGSQVGVASGMNANIRTIGGSVGAAVLGTIITSKKAAGGLPVESGYTHGFLFLFAAAGLAAVACAAIPSDRRRPSRSEYPFAGADEHVVHNGEAALVAGAPLAERD